MAKSENIKRLVNFFKFKNSCNCVFFQKLQIMIYFSCNAYNLRSIFVVILLLSQAVEKGKKQVNNRRRKICNVTVKSYCEKIRFVRICYT